VEVGDHREQIDADLAPLIEQLWKAGIETMMSCQETEPGIAWIEFDSPADILRFLNLVLWYEDGPDSLYARANWQRFAPTPPGSWEYQFNLVDILEDQEEQTVEGFVFLDSTVGLYFPRSDIPELHGRLMGRNQSAGAL